MIFKNINRLEALVLFVGDIVVFYFSLWLALIFRRGDIPSPEIFGAHVTPFTIIFLVWLLVFFIAGLYEKHTTILKSRLPFIILNAQIVNSILAVLFFYLIPYFGITPKTTLFIYLVVSFVLIVGWRHLFPLLGGRRQQPAILIASGREMQELMREVNDNPRYGLHFVSSVDLSEVEELDFEREIVDRIYTEGITTVVIDTNNEKVAVILPRLYNLIFSSVRFIDMHKVYEDIFDRVPLSLVEYSWFLENISVTRKFTYEFLKRLMDILITLPLFLLSLVLLPFVALAIKADDGGRVFIRQERVGKNNKPLHIVKYRTMTEDAKDEQLLNDRQNPVTHMGNIIRKARIDELPQLWNVLKGDLSLIGPRPELPVLVKRYQEEVPFYNIRHLIKPGLSGWGQIRDDDVPRKGVDVGRTRTKLSYDLYYIKNRSFLLDLAIALKTIKTFLSRTGR
ncbi:exopolysaccharide biosynthesis polyprenyl glycosylphosphotransferase [Candidatus Wolfebacteria bacterium]|nr:exopolysaccharide biosynthesis polyprenyl glycosylphosphotransferase [Candidatus Wolfebacteria bacterium]